MNTQQTYSLLLQLPQDCLSCQTVSYSHGSLADDKFIFPPALGLPLPWPLTRMSQDGLTEVSGLARVLVTAVGILDLKAGPAG